MTAELSRLVSSAGFRNIPPEVIGVADLVAGLQQQCRGQQAGRYAVPIIVRTVDLGKIVIDEQLAPQ